MGSGWPLDGPSHGEDGRLNPSFVPSDIDIPVFPGEDRMYLDKLRAGLGGLDRFGPPDLAVVVSGADPYEKDELPSTSDLRLTLDEMFDRDRSVYAFLKERRIPMAYLMAGGYGDHSWEVYSRFLEWALSDRKVC
jgi:acetoin utilization deacetylase AcuC-like enzyme